MLLHQTVSPFLLPGPIPSTLHILVDSTISSSSDLVAFHTNSWTRTFLIPGSSVIPYLTSLQAQDGSTVEDPNALKNVQIREVDFSSLIKTEAAEKGNAAQAGAAKGESKDKKKPDGKKEDAYEMAVAYTKEGDFPGWYSDVSGFARD
jgi:prolyl-tRNA synthetase